MPEQSALDAIKRAVIRKRPELAETAVGRKEIETTALEIMAAIKEVGLRFEKVDEKTDIRDGHDTVG